MTEYRKSKRAKALFPTKEAKDAVWERDHGRCVWCTLHPERRTGYPAYPEAHFISRSKSGLGIEQNLLTLCRPHHDEFDHSMRTHREEMRAEFAEYLKSNYPDWDESELIYRRYQ